MSLRLFGAAWFSTSSYDVMDGWFTRCAGCGRLLRATKRPWCTRPTDGAAFHLKCARPFRVMDGLVEPVGRLRS